jgi:hypothetical protein
MERQIHVESLPLSLVTLTTNIKPQEIFKLNSLNHIIIKVELYRVIQSSDWPYAVLQLPKLWSLMFEVWWWPPAQECPEKTNAESMPSCCSCTLVVGEKPPLASYRGCSHAEGKLQRRRAQ